MNPKESIGKRPELKILKVINSLAMLFATVALPIVTNPVSGNEKFPAPPHMHVPTGERNNHGFYLPSICEKINTI